MTNLKFLLTASALALVLGVAAPAFACEDCDKHTKDGKKIEKHEHKDGDDKNHSNHESHKDGDHELPTLTAL